MSDKLHGVSGGVDPSTMGGEPMEPTVLCNAFPDDNKGGCAITQQTVAWLKRFWPGSPVLLVPVEQDGEYDPRQHRFTLRRYPEARVLRSPVRAGRTPLATVRALVRSLVRLWLPSTDDEFGRALGNARVVVSKGGFVFVERETVQGILALWFTAYPLVYATARIVPTVVLCSTVGPYRRTASRLLCGWILRRVDVVVTRDPSSTREARALGCKEVVECPDISFTLDSLARLEGGRVEPGTEYAVVVVSGERRAVDRDFMQRMAALTAWLVEDGVVERVRVAVQSLEDQPCSERLVAAVDDPRVTLVASDLAPEDLLKLYGGARIVITKRLHAGLFAMTAGAPALLFATDGVKTHGVLEQLGLLDRLLPYPAFSLEETQSRVREILAERNDETERIRRVVARSRREAQEVLGGVARRLGGERARP